MGRFGGLGAEPPAGVKGRSPFASLSPLITDFSIYQRDGLEDQIPGAHNEGSRSQSNKHCTYTAYTYRHVS